MSKTSFEQLRTANRIRLPQFKTKQGVTAHKKEDGSDWTVAQWLQAELGELGEFAAIRVAYERGEIDRGTYELEAARELPDSAIYHDLLALRALDVSAGDMAHDPATILMRLIAHLGSYANARKKFERGDFNQMQLYNAAAEDLHRAHALIGVLAAHMLDPVLRETMIVGDGVDMGRAVEDKFNAVSDRVGATVWLRDGDVAVHDDQSNGARVDATRA